jgi:N-acetylated-alpha-linked acidic dipeptidase
MIGTISVTRRKAAAAGASIVSAVLVASAVPGAQSPPRPSAVESEISAAEIERTLRAIDVDRTSGSDGERASAEYLDRKLAEYGVAHATLRSRVYLSWPGHAALSVPSLGTISGKTAAFSAATPQEGLRGQPIVDPPITRRVDRTLAFDADVRNRIPIVRGYADTEALVLAAQQAGALAVVQIDATDTLHEDIVTTTWGTPSVENAARLPAIPYLTIAKSDGDRLMRAAAKPPIAITMTVDVTRGWRTIPIVVADVPGRTRDFVLVATHLDAWYHGMTDTGGSVASILDMARVLQRHAGELQRGVRFAWWTGHSFGRYAGSAWYADRFWSDLDRHCVAYTNLDGPGRRGSRMDAVATGGWPGLAEYARESAERLTGKTPLAARNAARAFRPGRDSDSSFQGLGIPFFSIGVPGPEPGSPDVDAAGRIVYWHTAEDTSDKLDLNALALDARYRVAQLYDLATARALPHRLEPIAAAYVVALKDLAAGAPFDLASTLALATALDDAAARFDRAARPEADDQIADFNALVVRLTHDLNATLYTKAGRFDQDPAAELPVLPLLARVKDLAGLAHESDAFGFLETEMIRGRNRVESTLRGAAESIEAYLSRRRSK